MAKIVHSSLAPSEKVTYSLGGTSFEINGGNKTAAYETDDPQVVADARAHPWLDVVVPKAEQVEAPPAHRLAPEDDILSAKHPDAKLAFDADAAKAALVEQLAVAPVAIDAGLDQDTKVVSGEVAETLAAAEVAVEKAEAANEKAETKTTSKEKK